MLHVLFALAWFSLSNGQTDTCQTSTEQCVGFLGDGCHTASNQCKVCLCNAANTFDCMFVSEAYTVATSDTRFIDAIKTECQLQCDHTFWTYSSTTSCCPECSATTSTTTTTTTRDTTTTTTTTTDLTTTTTHQCTDCVEFGDVCYLTAPDSTQSQECFYCYCDTNGGSITRKCDYVQNALSETSANNGILADLCNLQGCPVSDWVWSPSASAGCCPHCSSTTTTTTTTTTADTTTTTTAACTDGCVDLGDTCYNSVADPDLANECLYCWCDTSNGSGVTRKCDFVQNAISTSNFGHSILADLCNLQNCPDSAWVWDTTSSNAHCCPYCSVTTTTKPEDITTTTTRTDDTTITTTKNGDTTTTTTAGNSDTTTTTTTTTSGSDTTTTTRDYDDPTEPADPVNTYCGWWEGKIVIEWTGDNDASLMCNYPWGSGVFHQLFTDDSKFYIYWKIHGLDGCDKSDNTDSSIVTSNTKLYMYIWIYFIGDLDTTELNLLSRLAYYIKYAGPSIGFSVSVSSSQCWYSTGCGATTSSNTGSFSATSCDRIATCVSTEISTVDITASTSVTATQSVNIADCFGSSNRLNVNALQLVVGLVITAWFTLF